MSDFDALAAYLDRMAIALPQAVSGVTSRSGLATLAKVKSNASGRPGPRRVTGDYTRSINLTVAGDDVTIGTNAAQALRLEYGFHGADSRGRRYNQPALPHWRPAAEWAEGRYVTDMHSAVGDVIG